MEDVEQLLANFSDNIEYLKHLLQNQDSFEGTALKALLVQKQDALENIERVIVEKIGHNQTTKEQQYLYWRLRKDFLQTIQNLSHKRPRRANSLDENTWERVNITESKSKTFVVHHELEPHPARQSPQLTEHQQQQLIKVQLQSQRQTQTTQEQIDNYQTKDEILNDIVKERNQKIRQIKQDLESVHDLMQEIHVLVNEQSETLNTLEIDAKRAESQSNQATYEIADASRAVAKNQWDFKFKLLATALGGTVGLVGAGPFGLAIGTGVGLGVASYVGKKLASFKTWQIDEELFKHQISKNWVKDEDSPNCFKCKSQFTWWFRRHHCRFCNQIFCANCSSQNLPLKLIGIEQPRPERSCDVCYERYWNGDTWIADHGRQMTSPPV